MSTRKITLSDRPPVRINEDNWPIIASATDEEHDGKVEVQANCTHDWSLCVRQHEDGRTIVYATYRYSSNWARARGYHARHGLLLPTRPDADSVCKSIVLVAERMAGAENQGEDSQRWEQLADDCIADMPAVEI